MKTKRVLGFLFLCCFFLSSYAQESITLKVMDPAPAFKPLRWLKGKPIGKLEDDQLYVLELTGVYCPACITSIPHLSKLTDKYAGKAKFIAAYVLESEAGDSVSLNYVDRVQQFVNRMGNKIKYDVAIDDQKQTLLKTWMSAAGETGIPTSFIVRNGKVVWIGRVFDLEPVLEKIFSGSFDAQEVAANELAYYNKHKIGKALKNKNFARAIAILDSLIQVDPGDQMRHYSIFEYSLNLNEKEGYRYGYRMLRNECKDNEGVLFKMAIGMNALIANNALSNPDYDLAYALCDRSFELNQGDDLRQSMIIDLKAKFKSDQAKYHEALKLEEEALKYLSRLDPDDFRARDFRSYYRTEVETYKEKLK